MKFDAWKRLVMRLFPKEAFKVPGNDWLYSRWERGTLPADVATEIRARVQVDRDATWFVSRPSEGWTLYNPSRRLVSRHSDELEAARAGVAAGASEVFVNRPDGTVHLWGPSLV